MLPILQNLTGYIDAKLTYTGALAKQAIVRLMSMMLVGLLVTMVGLMGLGIISFAGGWWLGEWIGKPYWGLFIVGLFYAGLTTLLYIRRKNLVIWLQAVLMAVLDQALRLPCEKYPKNLAPLTDKTTSNSSTTSA